MYYVCLSWLTLTYMLQNNHQPHSHREQDIRGWPTFNLASATHILEKFGLSKVDDVEFLNTSSGLWGFPEPVNRPIRVHTDQWILIRRAGVQDCLDLAERLQHAQVSKLGGLRSRRSLGVPAVPASSKRKRIEDAESIRTHPASRQRLEQTISSISPPQASGSLSLQPSDSTTEFLHYESSLPINHSEPLPCSIPNTPLTPLLHELAITQPTISTSEDLSPSLAVNQDEFWDLGYVFVPLPGHKWPSGMYARDVVKGFELMLTGGEVELETRFEEIFRGAHYVQSTYYKHALAFKRSTWSEQELARSASRSFEGTWSQWCKSSSGWQRLKSRRT